MKLPPAPVRGWVLRLWLPNPTRPGRGRAIAVGGPADSGEAAQALILQAIVDSQIPADPGQTLGYLFAWEPREADLEGILAHGARTPGVISLVTLTEAT